MLQNRRPEERLHAREELRTEDLESFGGFCSGCMRRHTWPVIAQADGRSGGGGAREWLRLRYCASEWSHTPLRARPGWAPHHFAARFSRRLVRISPHHAAVGEAIHGSRAVDLRGIGGSAATAGGYDAANMAEDVHQLAEHLHLEHVYVVGPDTSVEWLRMPSPMLSGDEPRGDDNRLTPHRCQAVGRGMRLKANRITWHITFQQTPGLPEQLFPVAKLFICVIFLDSGHFQRCGMSPATPGHMPLPNICVRRWRSIGPFQRMRNSMRRNRAPSACRWYSLRKKLAFRETHAKLRRCVAGAWVRKC